MAHLAVFSSTDSGLGAWERIGSLSREVALYKRFAQEGWDVSFYTYDRTRKLPDIGFAAEIHPQWPLLLPRKAGFLYRMLLPRIFFHKGRKADVIITNQAHSGGPAIAAGRMWKAKVVARCGYVYGESVEALGKCGRRVKKKIQNEKKTFEKADRCVVPTKELAEWVTGNYGIPPDRITVIPNYVDTELFRPNPGAVKGIDVLSIGRLTGKKRHRLLLDALAGTRVTARIVGSGRLKEELERLAQEMKINLRITQRVEHELLPRLFNSSKIFVNLAEWEGHPKALIEAMACGCACIGARSAGIENLIIDGETGMLVKAEPQRIREAVETLLGSDQLRRRLGQSARDYAVRHFSLDKVFEQYKRMFQEVLAG